MAQALTEQASVAEIGALSRPDWALWLADAVWLRTRWSLHPALTTEVSLPHQAVHGAERAQIHATLIKPLSALRNQTEGAFA